MSTKGKICMLIMLSARYDRATPGYMTISCKSITAGVMFQTAEYNGEDRERIDNERRVTQREAERFCKQCHLIQSWFMKTIWSKCPELMKAIRPFRPSMIQQGEAGPAFIVPFLWLFYMVSHWKTEGLEQRQILLSFPLAEEDTKVY